MAATEEATQRWQKATESLSPEVLDSPVSKGGCGPPVLTVDDLGEGNDG